jgi:membrane-bound lytic murein transglycosylase B
VCTPALARPVAAAAFDLKRPEIAAFVSEVAARDGMSKKEVRALLRAAQPQPKIIELMSKPLEKAAPWWQYRDHFLTSERIDEGVQFWNEHQESLARIGAEYQVPPEYVVAILGVETKYGRVLGKYRVLDSLATLAFDYPPRQAFFRSELEQFLVLARENKLDPLTLMGSYAGAMGAPQFMPSSYRRYAVDANTDTQRDLWATGTTSSRGRQLSARKGWGPAAGTHRRHARGRSVPTSIRTTRSTRPSPARQPRHRSTSRCRRHARGCSPPSSATDRLPGGFHNFRDTRYNAARTTRHGGERPPDHRAARARGARAGAARAPITAAAALLLAARRGHRRPAPAPPRPHRPRRR